MSAISKCYEIARRNIPGEGNGVLSGRANIDGPAVKQNFMYLVASWTELAARVEDLDWSRKPPTTYRGAPSRML
jgi:hypothetical protein